MPESQRQSQRQSHHSRIRSPQIVIKWLWAVSSGKVATKAHAGTAHQGHLSRIEHALRITCSFESLVGHGTGSFSALSTAVGVDIVQIVLAELNTHSLQVERTNQGGQFVPWDEFVDDVEEADEEAVEKVGLVGRADFTLCASHGVWRLKIWGLLLSREERKESQQQQQQQHSFYRIEEGKRMRWSVPTLFVCTC